MASIIAEGSLLKIETDKFTAQVKTEGYVTGVAEATFTDKKTGARERGYGLDIVDFLMEPGEDDATYAPHRYDFRNGHHGSIAKRFVELPQICTQAKKVEYQIVRGKDFVAVKQWFKWTIGTAGRKAGSLWEQWLVFPDGQRYFFASDRVTCASKMENVFMRLDLPGHIKHKKADTFANVYLSYKGVIPAAQFLEDFPPDGRGGEFLYQRGKNPLPERMIRAYQVKLDGKDGPWLAGMTLDPAGVYEAWCHQRGYVCLIEEIGGVKVEPGGRFGAAYILGWFDDVAEMERAYDKHKGARRLEVSEQGYKLMRDA